MKPLLRRIGVFLIKKVIRYKNALLIRISPVLYLKSKYRKLFGMNINLDNPKGFAEKIQWLKINNQDERIVKYADKFLVREFVAETVGEEYLIPMPFVWERAEDVDFEMLPEKFVLKPNNSSGRVLICKDKAKLDKNNARKILKSWEKENLTKLTGEWVYERIPFKIVCEEFLADDIIDYKMYYSDGEFICTQVITERESGEKKLGYFDDKWTLLNIKRYHHPAITVAPEKPSQYEEMLRIGKKLSQDFPFVRVDLYFVNNKVYFGELSFYPNNGFVRYETEEMDRFFSEKIKLDS